MKTLTQLLQFFHILPIIIRVSIITCLITSIILFDGTAQTKSINENQLKAAFIYNFTRFINWPPQSFTDAESPFIIGIFGEDRLSTHLNLLIKGEKLNNRPIIIKTYSSAQKIGACHILFISSQSASEIKNQLWYINRKSTLTVSDMPNFAKTGGIIGFYKVQNKLKLQINMYEVKHSELIFSSKLLSLCNIYNAN